MLTSLIESGAIALIAIAIIAVEIVVVWLRQASGRMGFAANGLSGILILGALGLALANFSPLAVATALALSFGAHVVYLASSRRR